MRIEGADADSGLPVVALAREYGHGTRVPPHAHRRAQLLYAVTGTLRVTTAAGAWIVPSLRAVWIPPGVEHGFVIAGDVSMRTLYVDAGAAVFPDGGRCRVVAVSGLLRALILAACDEKVCDERAGEDRARAALMSGLILSELARAPEVPLSLPMPRDKRLAALCRALLDDPARDDTLEGWAESCGASARTLARLFRRDTGLSFGVWRQQARLAEALARLAQGEGVAAAARAAGYGSPSAFTAMFRRALGETPQRYAEGVVGAVTARPSPPAAAGSRPRGPGGRTGVR